MAGAVGGYGSGFTGPEVSTVTGVPLLGVITAVLARVPVAESATWTTTESTMPDPPGNESTFQVTAWPLLVQPRLQLTKGSRSAGVSTIPASVKGSPPLLKAWADVQKERPGRRFRRGRACRCAA